MFKNRSVIRFWLFLIFLLTNTSCNVNETALSMLGWVKSVKGDAVNITNFNKIAESSISHSKFTELLKKHVADDGLVDYVSFKKDETELQVYLDLLSNNAPSNNWTEAEKLAYWINAYNAFTIKLIVDNLPVKSIKDIGGAIPMINSPWDIKFFEIGGLPFDLNTIEHEILRKQFSEPRIHFAINCASISCPKLINEAYSAEKLEEQLNKQTKAFINDKSRNDIRSEKAQISKIFDWFKVDFTKNGTLAEYINQYSSVKIDKKTKVDFLDYNWDLNKK